MPSVILFLTLAVFYLSLSGQFHIRFLMVAGAVCCLAVTLLARHMRTVDDEGIPARFWIRTALYVPWLLWQVLLANIDVAKRVWNPRLPINPKLEKVSHRLETGYGIATYANSITLTPGTVTVEAGEHEFVVHALTDEAMADLNTNAMHDRVKALEAGSGGKRA